MMAVATISRRYYIGEAIRYISEKTGAVMGIREFRFLIERKHIPFLKSPGPAGHHFWTQAQLDEIASEILKDATWRQDVRQEMRREAKKESRKPAKK